MNNRKIIAICGSIILIVFCLWFFEGRRIYSKVGDFKIYKEDIEHRNNLIKMNYPKETKQYGYEQLEKAYINYQIMRNFGYDKIEDRVENESERINKNTKNPDLLKKIKEEIFNGDESSYERAFVIPAAVNEEIYFGFYLDNSELQKDTLKIAQDVWQELSTNPIELKALGKEKNLLYRIVYIHLFKGVVPVNQKTMKPIELERPASTSKPKKANTPSSGNDGGLGDRHARFWINSILKDLKPGDLISQPVSTDEQWYVGKVLKKSYDKKYDTNEYMVEYLVIPKLSYTDFFEREKKNVPIKKGFFLF